MVLAGRQIYAEKTGKILEDTDMMKTLMHQRKNGSTYIYDVISSIMETKEN